MKIYAITKDSNKELMNKMEEWFEERTQKHIELVRKYCHKVADAFEEFEDLRKRAKSHDDSKFEDPEMKPYVYITWKYKCEEDGSDFEECNPPEDLDGTMIEATEHHVTTNRHHPEYHSDKKTGFINHDDRDKPPEEMVDATKMPDLDIAEMVADWCGVSEERGNSPQSWAKKNINVRWKFTQEQEDLIYTIIDAVWG